MVNLINIRDVTSKKYIVPDFQRDYAWTESNLEVMLNDIMEAWKQEKDRYILGPIVVSWQNKVIDGQQRLTSLMILLRAFGCCNIDCFLRFENRKHIEDLFKILGNPPSQTDNEETNNHPTCDKIRAMYQFTYDYLSKNQVLTKNTFFEYLMDHVYFLEKQLCQNAAIQHAFEVLNTAGENLKKEDIAKSRIIANMVDLNLEKESELFNFAWLLCCDIENDLDENIVKKSKEISKAEKLEKLYDVMKDFLQHESEGSKVSLSDIVHKVETGKIYSRTKSGTISDFQSGRYSVCLTSYEFIDLVLTSSIEKSISDIAKTDSVIKEPEQAFIIIKSLLLYRIAFDQYVVKREKGNTEWFMTKSITEHSKRLICIQSMLTVSGVESSKKLVSLVKEAMDVAIFYDTEICSGELIRRLEEYAIERAGIEPTNLDNLDKGVETDHFVFHWLDYILWLNPPEEIKEKSESFSFINTSSVEHFMPQHLLSGEEHSEEWKNELNNFGNLALITPSSNSRQSNLPPKNKAENAKGKRIESLKYELMLHIASTSEWTAEASKEHGLEMKKLLSDYKTPHF
ncbi:MAG: DUF262 domain-containing HNH endonuclease family protein [Erysipelotrichaceae bacterium]|nr:DUF262 domain-containing HNH endonuclease family protein [Erysipelotrichaceae bacterium]